MRTVILYHRWSASSVKKHTPLSLLASVSLLGAECASAPTSLTRLLYAAVCALAFRVGENLEEWGSCELLRDPEVPWCDGGGHGIVHDFGAALFDVDYPGALRRRIGCQRPEATGS